MIENFFSIYAIAKCSSSLDRGVWVATTVASGKKPYTVDFDGMATCSTERSLVAQAFAKALDDLEIDGRKVIIYTDDPGLEVILAQGASGQTSIAAGSTGWKHLFLQLQRHDILVGQWDSGIWAARYLQGRLDALLADLG